MATDQVVSSKDVLQALMELRRVGGRWSLEELERQEPDLTEFMLEELSALHALLLESGAAARHVRRASRRAEATAVVLVSALRQAHRRLWREEAEGTRLAEVDPSLGEGGQVPPEQHPPPPGPADAPPPTAEQ